MAKYCKLGTLRKGCLLHVPRATTHVPHAGTVNRGQATKRVARSHTTVACKAGAAVQGGTLKFIQKPYSTPAALQVEFQCDTYDQGYSTSQNLPYQALRAVPVRPGLVSCNRCAVPPKRT